MEHRRLILRNSLLLQEHAHPRDQPINRNPARRTRDDRRAIIHAQVTTRKPTRTHL